jgi:tetratricopeptide (TPR) repeat protein
MYLNNLATSAPTRFQEHGETMDIDEAIGLYRAAHAFHAPPHSCYYMSLHNLANAIQERFDHQEDSKDIDEAIQLGREAVGLHAPPHPHYQTSISNLASAIQARFEERGDSKDIDEAIELSRESLALCPLPHPAHSDCLRNLGIATHVRFKNQGDLKDIDEALMLHKKALALCTPPDPGRIKSLAALGFCLIDIHVHSPHTGDLDQACALLQEATMYLSSSPRNRFRHARSWAFTAEQCNHPSALPAYRATIELLPQLAALHLDLPSRQEILFKIQAHTIASDAASCAVDVGQFHVTVEFLEASRSVFWSQALHLQTTLGGRADITPELAQRLIEVSRQLE